MMLCKRLVMTDSTTYKKAFVVPAFEYTSNRVPPVPPTKNELLVELDTRRVQIFRRNAWIRGHAATNYDRWRHANQEYPVSQ